MSDFARAARAMQTANIRHFGGGATCTLIRRMSIQKNGTSDVLLEVNGNQLAGAATLSLKLAGLRLGNSIPEGAKFTLAGNATEYTLTADAVVTTIGQISVAITPVLAANADDGTDVTWTQPNGQWTYSYSRDQRQLVDAPESGGQGVAETVNLEATDALPVPRNGDLLQFSSTNRKTVLSVRPIDPGAGAGRYVVDVGEVR